MINRAFVRELLDYKNVLIHRDYVNSTKRLRSNLTPTSKLAVVIHLYYEDNWPLFTQRLENINSEYDLFVTVPRSKLYLQDMVNESFPEAICIPVPNKGRDVLPFIWVAQVLYESGYEYVLKFHSKKSTHWEGGQDWLEGMMERLLPEDSRLINKTLEALSDPMTGIVGPSDVYYPLTINFPANGVHMDRVVSGMFGKTRAHQVLQSHRREYGFFGGTMFWARLDAIFPLFKTSVWSFESEKGQIDGTYAHALERLFCILPEMNGRTMYELTLDELRSRAYKSDNIPEWSTDHDKK